VQLWLKNQRISSDEVLYVGDGLQDMKAAQDAGFNFIGVETGLTTSDQFKKYGSLSLPSLASLPAYLQLPV